MTTTAASAKQGGLQNVPNTPLRVAIGNMITGPIPVLAIETDANDIQTTAAINFNIGGYTYTKAALADVNQTITSSDDGSTTQADATTCLYAIAINAAGTVLSYKGVDGETVNLPRVPDNVAVFGIIKVVNASGATFTQGTEDYDASDVTTTFHDVNCMPTTAP